MIFMSQIRMTRPEWSHQFGLWYQDHLSMMRSVPGIHSAQRFETTLDDLPLSLAMYTISGPDLFKDPYYLQVRGLHEWSAYHNTAHYKRNLFSGLNYAPEVMRDQELLVADRNEPDQSLEGFTWLTATGLDLSTPVRGIAVVHRDYAERHRPDIVRYVPVTGAREADLFPQAQTVGTLSA